MVIRIATTTTLLAVAVAVEAAVVIAPKQKSYQNNKKPKKSKTMTMMQSFLSVTARRRRRGKNLHRIVGFDLELFWWAKRRITKWSEMIRAIRLLVGVIICRTKAPTADTYMHACQTPSIYLASIEREHRESNEE